MTRDYLKPALDRAKSIEDMAKSFGVEVGQGDTLHLVNLASALRSAWAEIDRIKGDRREYAEKVCELREEENFKLREFLWLNHGHSIVELYGDDGEMQCSKCGLDYKRDSIDTITAALRRKLDDASYNPSLDAALNEGDGTYKP